MKTQKNSYYGATETVSPSTSSLEGEEETAEISTATTSKTTSNTNSNTNVIGSTFALCLCTLTHAYLSVSVFPYAGFMAIDLIDGVNEENAGSYAGLIASSFMVGRFISSYWWGKAADTYGRLFCLFASLAWSSIFVLLFGIASTFWYALFWRFCLGLGNGMVGTAKTTISELAKGQPRDVETTTMGWLIAMWGLAGLIGPALGGLLAEPVSQYPELFTTDDDDDKWMMTRTIRDFLTENKFVLPNLVGTIFCIIAMIAIYSFVEETLPDEQRRSITKIPQDLIDKIISITNKYCSCTKGNTTTNNSNDNDEETLPLNNDNEKEQQHQPQKSRSATIASLWNRPTTRQHLLVYWGGSFVGVAADEIFPLFCISQQAGLGLEERGIGKILSLGAFFFVVLQYPIYSRIVKRYGIYPSIRIGLLVTIPLFMILPSILLVDNHFSNNPTNNGLSWMTLAYSTFLLSIYRVFGLIFFSTIQVALNNTVPDHQRATLNGFDMLGNSAVKSFGPYLAGVLFSISVSSGVFSPPTLGLVVPFGVVSVFGFILTWSTFYHLTPPPETAATALDEANDDVTKENKTLN